MATKQSKFIPAWNDTIIASSVLWTPETEKKWSAKKITSTGVLDPVWPDGKVTSNTIFDIAEIPWLTYQYNNS